MRPGQTDWSGKGDEPERVRSHADISLNEAGHKDAHEVAEILRNKQVSHVYHDGLNRTRATATPISSTTGGDIRQSQGFSDWNVGEYIGQTHESAKAYLKYYQKHPDISPKGGETYNTWYDRYQRILLGVMSDMNGSPHDRVVITHGRNFTITPHILTDGEAPIDTNLAPDNGGIIPIRVGKGKFSFGQPNDVEPENN